ncbi:hypothetical protein [Pseudofrankia sp. DC12]|uniref:hypothetical protein n=1 Tax=Pseudofrankia sp. DC12 TaxID=683315 RepID=UPI0005F86AD0|nr:hypothetical protein [Pseudofrankia sp. DC12]
MDSARYLEWQIVLEETFFNLDWADQPVILYVDDDEAAAIQDEWGLETPLVEAVRRVVRPNSARPYWVVEALVSTHARQEAAPPVLPLLACAVIAATRMANDGVRRKTNYHYHFSTMLAGQEGALTSDDYKALVDMWEALAGWQLSWGTSRGLCTIPMRDYLPVNQSRIGYALSQAVLRGSDRQLLPRLFETLLRRGNGAWPQPGSVIVSAALLWDQYDRFSRDFRLAVEDEETRPVVERLLDQFASTWDGSPAQRRQGFPTADLVVRFENRELTWLARVPRQDTDRYDLPDGVRLHRIADTEYYEVRGFPAPDGGSLRAGVCLIGDALALSRPASPLVLLTENEALDCLSSVDRFVPGNEYMILAAPEAARDVEEVLNKAAAPGRAKAAGRLAWVPAGWTLHHGVRFDDALTLRQAIRGVQGPLLAAAPVLRFRSTLEGGLRLAPDLGKHLYLVGGEPELVVADRRPSEGAREAEVEILLDSDRLVLAPADDGWIAPVPLRGRSLPAGRHVIVVEDAELTFDTAEGAPDVAEPADVVGFPAAHSYPTVVPAGEPVLRGAWLADAQDSADRSPSPRIALCRRGAQETRFVSGDGRVWQISEPDVPAWWSRLGPPSSASTCFEVTVPVGGGWILQLREGAWRAEPVQPTEPAFPPSAGNRIWAQTVLGAADGSADPRWQCYVRLAEKLNRETAE